MQSTPPPAPGCYQPQVGDEVLYFAQGHHQFRSTVKWRQQRRNNIYSKPLAEDAPVWTHRQAFPCVVVIMC